MDQICKRSCQPLFIAFIPVKEKIMEKLKIKRSIKISVVLFCVGALIFAFQSVSNNSQASGENAETVNVKKTEIETAIENALYTRKEFFGSQAIVPFPTLEARKRLAEVSAKYPNNAEIFRKLAELDEKLGQFDLAEENLQKSIEVEVEKTDSLEYLFSFYDRRAEFEKAAEVLEKILRISPKQNNSSTFYRLISFAQLHEIEKYLTPEFNQQIAEQNPASFSIVENLIDKLETEKSYDEALKILRLYKDQFHEKQDVLLEKETSLLLSMNKPKEAEKVYLEAFDPFWSGKMSSNFYWFLKDQDRFRAYGAELKTSFLRDKSDLKTAVRLIHFRNQDGIYGNDSAANVILQVEKARSQKNIKWTGEELITASRLLLAEGEGDLASRFLYTLYLQGDLKPNSKLRAKILYQLFKLLIEANQERIALTKGDLKFYEDVGKSDPHPGITTGILSLIFSDTNPKRELAEKDQIATQLFNRAAAYRIFEAYKTEYPTSPELAKMYLDIVGLYIATDEKEIAEKTLEEFETRFEKMDEYPRVALTLAESFAVANKPEKEREIYQKILDHFGKEKAVSPQTVDVEDFTVKKETNDDVYENDYYYEKPIYNDFLTETDEKITYPNILERLISLLARENKTKEILAVYSAEIAKYPEEEWLYQKRLEQLEKTNLFDKQLQVYKTALAKFNTTDWRDRLARWFLRHERKEEFSELSNDIIEKLDDAEVQNYLSQFINGKKDSDEFSRKLYLKLYTTAHKRFPHNISFVNGLLDYYKVHKQEDDWRKLSAEYYFDSKEIRETFIKNLAEKGELRSYLTEAKEKCCAGDENSFDTLPYELFRADASAHLTNFEEAVAAYRRLNELYPNTPEYQERLIKFTRSFGQKDAEMLSESAEISKEQADSSPTNAEYRTRSGEIRAELGDYEKANGEWAKLIETAKGSRELYLETATIYWDYFQYEKALQTIRDLRLKTKDETIYAFQAGAILEAQNKMPEAVGEYIKAMAADYEERYSDKDRAKKRLVTLSNRGGNLALINAAFNTERRRQKDNSFLVLEYAEFLKDLEKAFRKSTENVAANERGFSQMNKEDKQFQISNIKFQKNAGNKTNSESQIFNLCSSVFICGSELLKQEVARSTDQRFLDAARYFFHRFDESENEIFTLRRLAKVAENPRQKISYYIDLAENLRDANQQREAGKTLSELAAKFPTNYGVLTESADIFWRMNEREAAVGVLQTGVNRGRGKYKYIFSRKLAAKFVLMDRLDSAENILLKLHDEDASDEKVFKELADIFVRSGKVENLRKVFAETLDAIKKQDIDTKVKNWQIAEFRTQMIEAFTRLKDYDSAIDQYIEIINREPDEEENTEDAIAFVKRYGGGERLLSYYQKTADKAYKNYRWNLVLARIFEANNDAENAVKNYKLAIANQPEMPELYIAWADLETRRKNYDVALENIDKVLELTNENTEYLKLKIKVLEKAGRKDEAEIVRQKLPAELRPAKTVSDQFADAQNLKTSEKKKAIAEYRSAFNKLLEDPFAYDLKAADVTGYVETLRSEEELNVILERLWVLREKFIAEAEGYNSTNAGKARNQLRTLDGAMPEAIGNIAKRYSTSDENLAIQKDLDKRIDEVLGENDRYLTLSLLRNIANRSGFGNLEESVLQKQLNAEFSEANYHASLRSMIDFYEARGMYGRVLEVLESSRQKIKMPEILITCGESPTPQNLSETVKKNSMHYAKIINRRAEKFARNRMIWSQDIWKFSTNEAKAEKRN
jgi:tetratricopeptide (TPR) repeat protein